MDIRFLISVILIRVPEGREEKNRRSYIVERLPFQYTMTKMVVTVFGGAGKLGQHTLPLLLAAGIEVRCLVRGSAARLRDDPLIPGGSRAADCDSWV